MRSSRSGIPAGPGARGDDPKANGKLRRLGIATVADRVVQASLKLVLEPIFEADFRPCSYGFRPRRRAQDAIAEIHYLASGSRAYHWVFEGDITACLDALSACFSAIPHDKLMQAVEERISDRTVLAPLQAMLRAGVLEDGRVRREVIGTPQGGPLSPLLCNVYLHRLDRVWDTREHGVLVRYCDDLVVMCSTRRQAEDALARLTTVLARLGLETGGQDPDRAPHRGQERRGL